MNTTLLKQGYSVERSRIFVLSLSRKLLIILFVFSIPALTYAQDGKSGSERKTGNAGLMWGLTENDPFPLQLSWMEIKLEPFVFNTTEFPKADFAQAEIAGRALGDYEISTTYYNSSFEQVTKAEKPGRYGAVVNIKFSSGMTLNRYYTIFKYPGSMSSVQWWQWAAKSKTALNFAMPAELGIDKAIEKDYADAISTYMRFGFYEDLKRRPYAARLLAGLYDMSQYVNKSRTAAVGQNRAKGKGNDEFDFAAMVTGIANDEGQFSSVLKDAKIIEIDRQWWVTLKQKLVKSPASMIAKDFKGPKILNNVAGILLTKAKPADVHVSPGITSQLDNMLTKWARESDQSFSVMLARDGKIFYSNSFGVRDSFPMKMNDKSHIASINKTFTGILLTMCIDRGYLSLDDEISRFFPGLKDVPQAKTITIRHLINHTSGLPDLSLDEVNDLEEVIKPFLSTAKVGEYAYNQTGYSLCGKIMEVITGKSYGLLLKEWLIVPMELTGTEVTGAASDAWSVPMDLAKIGQMLMNGGTYKNVQYFSKETYQNEMFPTEKNLQVGIGLVKTLATEATNYCGKATEEGELGTPGTIVTADKDITYTREQLEKIAVENNLGFGNLVGHPAISGSLFCMDVDNKLLMIVTRNSRGKDFMNHHKEFMQTIINNVKAN